MFGKIKRFFRLATWWKPYMAGVLFGWVAIAVIILGYWLVTK